MRTIINLNCIAIANTYTSNQLTQMSEHPENDRLPSLSGDINAAQVDILLTDQYPIIQQIFSLIFDDAIINVGVATMS